MYSAMFYALKCLTFRYLLKIDNISAKKDIANSKNLRTFALGNGNKADTKIAL